MADPATTSSFGYWVRRRRLALDLTQADLARAVSCATVTITKIERDERRPSRQLAALLADHLAIPPQERNRFLAVALGETAVDRLLLDGTPLAAPTARAAPPSNLPVPATPFVGRQSELSRLSARLADPGCRLLTLLGAGGFGKTRLAVRLGELALAQPVRFPDGVFYVPLDGVEAAEFVVPAIAAALSYTFYAQEDETKQLFHYLAAKRLLLILDNAEAVLTPDLVARLLAHAPQVTILVTTREALNLPEEWLNPIGGMAVGDPDAVGTDAAQPASADAIMFFSQCAQRVQPAFDLPPALDAVQRICRLVDGAPLAIELAAAWLKVLTCEQVAQQLAQDGNLLDTALHHMPARHRSMRAVLAQSWHYLAADERQVFRRLAIFEGGFRLPAAQAVVDAPLPVLAALAGKAMLHMAPDGRYRIHALVRQFAAEQLAAVPAELEACRARHAAYFMDFLAERSRALTGAGQMVALREIQEDMDNIRAAWSHRAGQGQLPPQSALRALFRFLWMRGRYQEGEQMASQALAGVDPTQLTADEHTVRVALLIYGAQFADAKGASDAALVQVQAALADAERIGSLAEQAHSYYVKGLIQTSLAHGKTKPQAAENLRHALELYRRLEDDVGIAETVYLLAFVLGTLGVNPETSLGMLEESLAILRKLGDVSLQADALNSLGHVAWIAGEIDRSEQAYRQSLAAALAAEDRLVAAQAIGGLGIVAWVRADWDQAIAWLKQRLELMQQLGHMPQVQASLFLLCSLYSHADRNSDAIALMHAYPDMWHTSWLAQAQAAAGMCEEVMSYLPQLTENASPGTYLGDISHSLVAWSLLLEGECTLQTGKGTPGARILSRAERRALAEEILSAVATYPPTDPATRAQAKRLLARLREQMPTEPPDLASAHLPPKSLRSIRDLADEVLTISLA